MLMMVEIFIQNQIVVFYDITLVVCLLLICFLYEIYNLLLLLTARIIGSVNRKYLLIGLLIGEAEIRGVIDNLITKC